jgi:hypothetical protein
MAGGAFERRYVSEGLNDGDRLIADNHQAVTGQLLTPASQTVTFSSATPPIPAGQCVYREATFAGRLGAGIDRSRPVPGIAVPPVPTSTFVSARIEAPAPNPQSMRFTVTSYGAAYNGSSLGCGGVYSSDDSSILAVGPSNYRRWPCGSHLAVCGPTGACLSMTRADACPGCGATMLDTSESAYAALCGDEASGPCPVHVGE